MSAAGGVGRRRTILYLNAYPELAGGERNLINLVCTLDRDRFRPIVLVPREGPLAAELRANEIDVRPLDLGVLANRRELSSPKLLLRLLALVGAAGRVARLIRVERVDLVHSNTIGVLAGALAAGLTRTPHVWHVREILLEPAWIWALMRLVIPLLSSRVVCMSGAIRERFRVPRRPRSKIVVIHDGIDPTALQAGAGEPPPGPRPDRVPGEVRVGVLARINPWKGQDVFVEAAQRVLRRFPDAHFYLAGGCLPVYEPLRRRLEDAIRAGGTGSRVHLLGGLPPHQAAALLRQLDILVVPSTSPEPFGMTALEAMAFAKPVIASDAGGPRDVIVPGVTGVLVPPGDADALAGAICDLLERPERRVAMGEAGRRRLAERFDLRTTVASIEAVYDELLARRGGRTPHEGRRANDDGPGEDGLDGFVPRHPSVLPRPAR
jgi:glycosyltransferase involved in cell wall biosynthesis